MTISRRGFLGGLAGLLSLLVWPWKSTPPEATQSLWWVSWDDEQATAIYSGTGAETTYGPDSDIVKLLNEPARDRTANELWEVLSNPPTLEELERRIDDEVFAISTTHEPTHFQGITKRYS